MIFQWLLTSLPLLCTVHTEADAGREPWAVADHSQHAPHPALGPDVLPEAEHVAVLSRPKLRRQQAGEQIPGTAELKTFFCICRGSW